MVNVNTRAPTMKVDIIVPVMLDIDSWKISSLVRVGLQCLHIFASGLWSSFEERVEFSALAGN